MYFSFGVNCPFQLMNSLQTLLKSSPLLPHSSLFKSVLPSFIHPSFCVYSFHPPGQGSQLQPLTSLSPSSSLSPCSEAQVTQFIQQFVASCLLVSHSNTELSYVLPSEAVKKGCFERLFQVHRHAIKPDLDYGHVNIYVVKKIVKYL